jgi:hypothetical protein
MHTTLELEYTLQLSKERALQLLRKGNPKGIAEQNESNHFSGKEPQW